MLQSWNRWHLGPPSSRNDRFAEAQSSICDLDLVFAQKGGLSKADDIANPFDAGNQGENCWERSGINQKVPFEMESTIIWWNEYEWIDH